MGRRNPNGYGCVTHLQGNRSQPWMVRITVYDIDGSHHQKAIGYTRTKEEGLVLLAKYNEHPWQVDRQTITFTDLYHQWLEVKAPQLGESNVKRMKAAFLHCQRLYGMKYINIKSFHMQSCINDCPRGYSTKMSIKNLFNHLDRYAFEMDIIDRMYSQITKVTDDVPETNRMPYTDEQISTLWCHTDDRIVRIALIFLYTGFRLRELLDMPASAVDPQEWIMTGGEKTKAGKNRIVPVHPRIRQLIQGFLREGNEYLITDGTGAHFKGDGAFRVQWNAAMERYGMEGKKPHECRHTFETMLDNAGGNRKCIDLLMGHASQDTGNRVYNHKTLNQLIDTISLLN